MSKPSWTIILTLCRSEKHPSLKTGYFFEDTDFEVPQKVRFVDKG
jgi:hypothetical protein